MTQSNGWDKPGSPCHPGERELHARLGLEAHQERMSRRFYRSRMPQQHREFFRRLPFLIVGSVDHGGWPWASVIFGKPGFANSPSDQCLEINSMPVTGDPLAENLAVGAPLGLLGIEFPTRRRNRMNGVVSEHDNNSFRISVVQSFGNCPKYIRTRSMGLIHAPINTKPPEVRRFHSIEGDIKHILSHADTFFVASHNDRNDKYINGGVDVSHRGGQPGFIKIDNNTLTIPDYTGNFAFNTLGNFLLNPKAGLLFIDFITGDLLMLTGTTELIWDKTPDVAAMPDAERAWRFTLDHGLKLSGASPLHWPV